MKVRNPQKHARVGREHRHRRIRAKVIGTAARPRLAVYRSLKAVSAQLIDDTAGRTLAAASEHGLQKNVETFEGRGGKVARAFAVGRLLSEKAAAAGITRAVFDRGGFTYHGRVRAVAEGARAGGLTF